jgi:hypothetical protein
VLYGVFVDGVVGAPANSFTSNESLCRVYWDQTPLGLDQAAQFIDSVRPTDIAVVIQSKSGTSLAIRGSTIAALRARSKHEH